MAGKAGHIVENDAIMAKTFGRRLTILRQNRGYTLAQTGQMIGVSQSQISSYEKGARKPTLSVLVGLSTGFGTTVDYLLGLEPIERGLVKEDPRDMMKDLVKGREIRA